MDSVLLLRLFELLFVVVSLIYLALQVKQGAKAMRAATYQGTLNSSREILSPIYENSEVRQFFCAVAGSTEQLNGEDELRWHSMMLVAFRHFDNVLFQHRLQTLAEELWPGYSSAFIFWLRYPRVLAWFDENRESFSEDLQAWVNENRPEFPGEFADVEGASRPDEASAET